MNFSAVFSALGRVLPAAADTAAETPVNTSSYMITQVLLIGGLLAFFYFVMFRPQKKKEKEIQAMRQNIQIGDEIVTAGGIVGFVVRKSDDTVVIETGGDKSKLRIKTWAIQENITAAEQAQAAADARKNAKKNAE